MKWQGREGSSNVEDRRTMSAGRAGGIGGIGLIAVVIIGYFLGIDVTPLLQQGGLTDAGPSGGTTELTEQDKAAGQFVSVTLGDTEKIWGDIFKTKLGKTYTPTELVLFKGATASACGTASQQSGPFYCPNDKKVYLDTDFFNLMSQQFGSQGDFAAAYVVAHEVGHHVQADCFAGVWARYAQDKLGTLEQGDMAEAVDTAARIGDDTLQRNAGRTPTPDSFTHGTSEQRQRWLAAGYKGGDITVCDTFSAQTL